MYYTQAGYFAQTFLRKINLLKVVSGFKELWTIRIGLMPEMAHPGQDHRQIVLISGGNDFIVTDRATGLDDRRSTRFNSRQQSIRKREERIRRNDRTLGERVGEVRGL